jgi:hypothetical protein
VRHVGQELGLVLRGQRQLGGLFLERAAGLLDLGVLALDLGVLLGEQPRLGAQFFVGLLEFALADCSSTVSCCDCLSRPSVRIVASMVLKHDADALW